MPMKLNVGVSQKVGEANYGSRGASAHIEVELGGALLHDPDKFRARLRRLYALVRQAVTEELHGGNNAAAQPVTDPAALTVPPQPPANGNGPSPRNGSPRPATPAQIKALYALTRQRGLNLADWLVQQAQVRRPEELSLQRASALIDTLKTPAQPTPA